MATKDEVWKMIEDAFASVPYPGDDQIVPDPEGYEMDELLRDFKGRHWRDIPKEVLRHHSDTFGLLTPAALKFYLPAYLRAALDNDPWNYAFSLLCTPSRKDEFASYSSEQKAAIRALLPLLGGSTKLTRHSIGELWS